MQESFIHFIWQYQYFNRQDLCTTKGEPVQVLKQGVYNRQNAGPDFRGAKLRVDGMDWYGDVELHIRSSDWQRHSHEKDGAYNSVILHVVWEVDAEALRQDGTAIPQLELRGRVEERMLEQYEGLMKSRHSIPCAPQLEQVNSLTKFSMLDKALLERLRRKSAIILDWVQENGGDWETAAYWLLGQNFGFKKNNEAFLALMKKLPLKVLAKHRDQPLQQEALLFGMAGFLEDIPDSDQQYLKQLQQEWNFLGQKYQLLDKRMNRHEWKFLRMRPANFPTVRLAQLAAVLHARHHLFSLFSAELPVKELIGILRKPQSAYWQEHYDMGKRSKSKIPTLGASSAQNLLINTAAPLLAAYGVYTDQESWIDRTMQLLQQISAESNSILDEWKSLGLIPQHAFDSQALLELYNEFCRPKQCLQCSIGLQLLKRREV